MTLVAEETVMSDGPSEFAEQADLLRREGEVDPTPVDGMPEGYRPEHSLPPVDHEPKKQYACVECGEIFATPQGVTGHSQVHMTEEERELRRQKNRETRAATKAAKEAITPEIRELIDASLVPGSKENEARTKRWYRAKKKGATVAQFEADEVRRFAKMINGKGAHEHVIATVLDEHAAADAMFAKVAAATRALVEPDEMFDRFEEVAELRRAMFEFLARR
jgi:hypothetical protein